MFWTRLASGIVLMSIALLTMGLGGVPLLTVLLIISMIAYYELTKVLMEKKDKAVSGLEIVGYLGIVIYYAVVYFAERETLVFMSVIGVIMAAMLVYVVTFPKYHSTQVMASCFSFCMRP